MKKGGEGRDDFENGLVLKRIRFQIHAWGSIVERRRGEESDGIMFFIQKFAFARKRVLRNACLYSAMHARRGRLKRNVTRHLCRGRPLKPPCASLSFYLLLVPPFFWKTGGRKEGGVGPGAHETPALIIFSSSFCFSQPRDPYHGPPFCETSLTADARTAGMRQKFPTRIPRKLSSQKENFQKFAAAVNI